MINRKKRPSIRGGFTILVVPNDDIIQNGLTVPMTYIPADTTIRAVAIAESRNVGASLWAFTPSQNDRVVKNLRDLANFLELEKLK